MDRPQLGQYRVPLRGGVILGVSGERIDSMQELIVYLETETAVGEPVELSIIRGGDEQIVQSMLEERPHETEP